MNAKIALTPKYTYGGCPAEEKKQPAPTQAGSATVEDGAVSSAAFADIVPEISAAPVFAKIIIIIINYCTLKISNKLEFRGTQ